MTTNQAQRPMFFENQYLGAADLTAAVEYARLQGSRHALGAHTWGIAMGLQLIERPSASGGGRVDVFVQPGFAWDGFGRPVVVLAPFKIPSEKFKSYVFDAAVDGGSPEGRLVEVWLRYAEQATQTTRPGFEVCYPADQYARVDEFFQVEVGERKNFSDQRDAVSVAGRTPDAREALRAFNATDPLVYDESIPYQTFPDPEQNARWLIPLGFVRWKPNPDAAQPGDFVKRGADDLARSRQLRRYAGVVAESVQAADGRIRLRDRFRDYSGVQSSDLVWVEGDLRVEGDAKLFGGKLDLRKTDGLHGGVPLLVQRAPNGSGADMQAVIGEKEDGSSSFAVGPVVANVFKGKLTVRDNGSVGVGSSAPVSTLQVAGDLALESTAAGAARVLPAKATMMWNDGTWLRLNQNLDFSKPVFGVHTPGLFASASLNVGGAGNWGDPGPGNLWVTGSVGVGTLAPSRKLHVEGAELHSGGAGGGLSFGNRSSAFVESPASGERWVWYADAGRARLWSGSDKLCVTPEGNVGVGTTSPARRLHVVGDRIRLENSGKRLDLRADGGALDLHSETNHLYLRSSGPGGNNNVILNPFNSDGNVGVGTEDPACKLHVQGTREGSANAVTAHVAVIENASAGGSADVLALKVGAGDADSNNNFVTFFSGVNAVGCIQGAGGGSVSYETSGADFAECLPLLREGEQIVAGDIVGVFAGKVSKATGGAHHLAAITGRPAVVGNRPRREDAHLYAQVAFVGQVPVRVRGPVAAGDFIVPSGLDDGTGRALSPGEMTPGDYARVVGRAWEEADGDGTKPVNVAVGVHSVAPLETLGGLVRAQQQELEALRAELEKLAAGGKAV